MMRAPFEVEVKVRSADGLLSGRVDAAERLPSGVRIIDYKSAVRDDIPARYERQLQIYALLWYETRHEWPVEAQLIYPFISTTHPIKIDKAICTRLGAESRALIQQILVAPTNTLGTPGDVCKVCEFRPWCVPFWANQANTQPHRAALEQARWGFEGRITRLTQVGDHWKGEVRWRDCSVQIVAPMTRFPQLARAQIGMRLRALDMRLYGQLYHPQVQITPESEIWLLKDLGPSH
jgi:hypothetical protein